MKEKKKREWDEGKINSKPSTLSVILFLKLHAMYGCFYVICTFTLPEIFVVYIIYVYVIIYIMSIYREGNAIKGNSCSSRRPRFNSQHLHGGLKLTLNSNSRRILHSLLVSTGTTHI